MNQAESGKARGFLRQVAENLSKEFDGLRHKLHHYPTDALRLELYHSAVPLAIRAMREEFAYCDVRPGIRDAFVASAEFNVPEYMCPVREIHRRYRKRDNQNPLDRTQTAWCFSGVRRKGRITEVYYRGMQSIEELHLITVEFEEDSRKILVESTELAAL